MVRVNCFFKADDGQYDAALQAAMALVAVGQKHEGCVAYDVFESATRPDIFMFCATWSDASSMAAHADSQDFKTYAELLRGLGNLKIESFEM